MKVHWAVPASSKSGSTHLLFRIPSVQDLCGDRFNPSALEFANQPPDTSN
jgi:hypothetical protein